MKEEWRNVSGYEGLYQVSNLGRIKSLAKIDTAGRFRKEKICNPSCNSDGYKTIYLTKDGSQKNFKVHRLIAETFIPNPEHKPCIDHIDGSRDNNRANNLRWCTKKENSNYPIAKSRCRYKGLFGIKHPRSKPIICLETKAIFWGFCEAERATGISYKNIHAACNRKRKTAGGYHWRYIED